MGPFAALHALLDAVPHRPKGIREATALNFRCTVFEYPCCIHCGYIVSEFGKEVNNDLQPKDSAFFQRKFVQGSLLGTLADSRCILLGNAASIFIVVLLDPTAGLGSQIRFNPTTAQDSP
jgi:hypothetical protein